MKRSNSKSKGRKLSVHVTRLTDEDINRIRFDITKKATKKGNKIPKAQTSTKKSSNSQPLEATESSKNCTSGSATKEPLQTRSQKTAKTTNKRKATSSSSKGTKKRKCAPTIRSSKRSSKVLVDDGTAAWNEPISYTSSDESELGEVFVPKKIWAKPSTQPLSLMSGSDTAPETHTDDAVQEIKFDITSEFLVRRPIVRLKKMSRDTDMKYEICDDIKPSPGEVQTSRSLDTSCCQPWQNVFRSSAQAKTISSGSDEAVSQSDEFADEKPQPLEIDQSFDDTPLVLENEVAPNDPKSKNASKASLQSGWRITGHSPPQCSCQLTVATETVTTAVQTSEPETSTQSSLLTNELAETSAQKTVSSKDVAERNQNDDAICSPVIFGEESQVTQEFEGRVSSPVIFGSNEGAESGDAASRSNNQRQDEISDPCDSSSSFVLELTADEQSEKEASKNGDLTFDASQNINLQLSETVSHQNVQSGVSSPEFFSSYTNALSSRTGVSSSSDAEASGNLSENEAVNIPENENAGFIEDLSSGNKKVPLSASNVESHSASNIIWLSAAKPSNPFENQSVSLHSVRSLYPKRPKISFLRKTKNLPSSVKSHSTVEDLSLCRSPKSPSSTTEASRLPENWKCDLSGLKASTSNPKKSYLSVAEPVSSSQSRKSCLSASQAAKIPLSKSPYLLPLKRLDPSSHQKSNLPSTNDTKLPASVPINYCNDAFTQTDLQEVQQPSMLSVNYIINSSSLDTIRFEGPVVNHPSAAIGEKIQASAILAPETHHCPTVFSANQTNRIPRKYDVGNFFHLSEVTSPESDNQSKNSTAPAFATKLPACCSDSILDSRKPAEERCGDYEDGQVSASECVIDLTDDCEPEFKQSFLGRIRLKTLTEVGCTIAFTDDVERWCRHELPKLQGNLDQLKLLKEKHFNVFNMVLNKYDVAKPLKDTLQHLCTTRSVPCGSNLLRHSPAKLPSVQMSVKSPLSSSTGSKLFYRNSSGIGNYTRNLALIRDRRDATGVRKPVYFLI